MATAPVNDLSEHIGTILWIAGGLLFICGVLIGLIWTDLKKKVDEIKREAGKFSEWLKKTGELGGRLVTEKLHFEWCKEQQANCPACESYRLLMDWRRTMMEKGGGIMTRTETQSYVKEVTSEMADRFCERLEEMFEHHRTLVAKEFQLLRLEIAKGQKT